MRVKSTGLGKTQLTANFDGFQPKEGGESSAVLIITSTEPVHWHIECDLGGKDLRQFAGQALRPGMVWHLLKLLVRGGEPSGFVIEEKEGRKGRKKSSGRKTTEADEAAGGEKAAAQGAEPASPQVSEAKESAHEEREERRRERRRRREEAAGSDGSHTGTTERQPQVGHS